MQKVIFTGLTDFFAAGCKRLRPVNSRGGMQSAKGTRLGYSA
ncbi:hypothetical protein [Methylomicrobium lacus]